MRRTGTCRRLRRGTGRQTGASTSAIGYQMFSRGGGRAAMLDGCASRVVAQIAARRAVEQLTSRRESSSGGGATHRARRSPSCWRYRGGTTSRSPPPRAHSWTWRPGLTTAPPRLRCTRSSPSSNGARFSAISPGWHRLRVSNRALCRELGKAGSTTANGPSATSSAARTTVLGIRLTHACVS